MANMSKVIKRNIQPFIQALSFDNQKMAFLSGPRQCGKTTIAKALLNHESNYFNWDDSTFKKKWSLDPNQIIDTVLIQKKPVIALDEIHKNTKWKNQVKGIYDRYGEILKIIVTGSAQLNTYRKGSDSLLGRFFHFHIMPFSFGELTRSKPLTFEQLIKKIYSPKWELTQTPNTKSIINRLFTLSGFPDPYLKNKSNYHLAWQKNRVELLIRQDLREISHTLNIGQIEILAHFLPDKIGSTLSIKSLSEDLDASYTTVNRWLNELQKVYYHFEIKPYSKNVTRSLKKEKKIYLYDWTQVEQSGPRFENMVAVHLLKLINFYNDIGQSQLALWYLRDKEKNELDFLVTNRNIPLFSVEVKLSNMDLDQSFKKLTKNFNIPHFQIIDSTHPIIKNMTENQNRPVHVLSFDQFFSFCP